MRLLLAANNQATRRNEIIKSYLQLGSSSNRYAPPPPIGVQSVRPTWFEDTTPKDPTSQQSQDPHKEQAQPLHGLKLVIKEEVLPATDQPQFQSLELLASRGLLAPDTWKCKRAQVSLKATIDVPMLGTIIEQNGDGLLEDSHMPVGWPLHIDGAVRQCCIHRTASFAKIQAYNH